MLKQLTELPTDRKYPAVKLITDTRILLEKENLNTIKIRYRKFIKLYKNYRL